MQTAYRVPFLNACCLLILFCPMSSTRAQARGTSLQDCFRIAAERNLTVSQAKTTLKATEYNLAAEKQSHLPKVDLLASYNYLSKPLEINLGTVRNGIVDGSSQQSVNTANEVFKNITGSDLSQVAQQNIYNTSKAIIGGIYPDYNPALSQQSYFVAGVFVRQPIYLGNKLSAAQNLAAAAMASARINVDVVGEEVSSLISMQYLRILYLNTILQKEASIVEILKKNKAYAGEMVKNQVLPPYQKNWATVFQVQAESRYSNLQLERKNAMLELKLPAIPGRLNRCPNLCNGYPSCCLRRRS
jgi:outer membrane protein TolC